MKEIVVPDRLARPDDEGPAAVCASAEAASASPTEVVPLVSTTASLLSQDPAMRDVESRSWASAPPVPADADMLRIVFQNLLINGAHAMQGNGTIRVAVETVDATCQIAFIDGGPGIPAEIRDKIFTPFFTTKSRGSGLGLPTAKRLIEAHQGQIAIDCPPSGGTGRGDPTPIRNIVGFSARTLAGASAGCAPLPDRLSVPSMPDCR